MIYARSKPLSWRRQTLQAHVGSQMSLRAVPAGKATACWEGPAGQVSFADHPSLKHGKIYSYSVKGAWVGG